MKIETSKNRGWRGNADKPLPIRVFRQIRGSYAGLPILTLQQLLGHQRVETTLRYARLYDSTVAADYGRAMAVVERAADRQENAD